MKWKIIMGAGLMVLGTLGILADDIPAGDGQLSWDFFVCVAPEMKKGDDFYRVNPMVRQHFYRQSKPPVNGTDRRHRDMIREGQFRLYIQDCLEDNQALVELARELGQKLTLDPSQSERYNFGWMLQQLEKSSRDLSHKLVRLLPGKLSGIEDPAPQMEIYRELALTGRNGPLFKLMFKKIDDFERGLSNLLFPRRFTVPIGTLNGRSTPLDDLWAVHLIAATLREQMPGRGLPDDVRVTDRSVSADQGTPADR